MLAITTFSQSGYELCGKKFLKSFKKNWPGNIIVYTEKELGISDDRIMERDFFEIEPVKNFYQYIDLIPKARGKTEQGYNYNFDLWKFSRKVFAQWDVLRSYGDKVFWLDADTIIRKPVPEKFLEDLFNDKGIVTFFREGWHSETGLVGFDTQNPRFNDFLNLYIGFLKSGEVFNLPQWHDCALLDAAVRHSKITTENLTAGWKQKKKYTMRDLKVFQNSVIAPYIIHRKGKKKER